MASSWPEGLFLVRGSARLGPSLSKTWRPNDIQMRRVAFLETCASPQPQLGNSLSASVFHHCLLSTKSHFFYQDLRVIVASPQPRSQRPAVRPSCVCGFTLTTKTKRGNPKPTVCLQPQCRTAKRGTHRPVTLKILKTMASLLLCRPHNLSTLALLYLLSTPTH